MQANGIDSVRYMTGGVANTNFRPAGSEVREASQDAAEINITDGFQSSDKQKFVVGFEDADTAKKMQALWGKNGSGVTMTGQLPLVNGMTIEVDQSKVDGVLTSLPVGSRIAVDRSVSMMEDETYKAGAPKDGSIPDDVTNSIIGIEKVWEKGFTGKGQTIAVIDSGIHPHEDLKDKIVAWVDLESGKADPYDSYGHGTHVAGIAAGNGVKSAGAHKGVAPDANVVGVRITNVSEAIKGIQWCIEHKDEHDIGVINMSLGDLAVRSYKDDPWAQAAQKAMEAGITVVVAAGNDGPSTHNISTPGTHPDVITVGALDDKRTEDRSDDAVADFSSRGPTIDGIHKPDVVAPGVNIFGPLSPGSDMDVTELPHDGANYFAMSGTSMATPIVSGLAACLRQANPDLSPKDIKEIIVKSCDDYLADDDVDAKGAGLINAEKALKLALEWNKAAEAKEAVASMELPTPVDHNQYDDSQGFLMA